MDNDKQVILDKIKKLKAKNARKSAVLTSINLVLQNFLETETEEELGQTCLSVAERLSDAKFGFFGEVNKEGTFDTIAISNPGWDECSMPESNATRLIKGMEIRGFQFLMLKDGKSRIFNDPSNHPESMGTPNGHPRIKSLLSVPFNYQGKIIGGIGLGNKEGGFVHNDQIMIEMLAPIMVEVLMRKRLEKNLRESEEKFRDLAETSIDSIFILNKEGRIIFLNSPGAKMYGYEPEEIINMNFRALMTKEGLPEDLKQGEKILSGQSVRGEINVKHKKGFEFPIYFSIVPLKREGNIIGFQGISRDITEQKKVENELSVAYHAIDSSGNGVIITNREGEIIYTNPAFISIFEYDSKEGVLGKVTSELFPGERIQKFSDVSAIIDKVKGDSEEFIVSRKDGSEFPVEVSGSIVTDKSGNEVGRMASFVDITERKKLENEIQAAKEYSKHKLEQEVKKKTRELNEALEHEKMFKEKLLISSQFKSEFMASMSHELRTPLNSIIGFTDVILERISGEINETQDKYLTNVKSSALHLLDLINDVLDIAKIESGKMELHIEEVKLSKIFRRINTMIKPIYEKKNLKFEVQKIDQEKVIRVDRIRFKEILYNLLSNAVKYTKEGIVKLEFSEYENYWKFDVIDTGIGIKEEDFDLVFQDFKRIRSEYVASIEGTGLGLSLAKKFIEYHGGNISFTSIFGKGSTFTFTIPKNIK